MFKVRSPPKKFASDGTDDQNIDLPGKFGVFERSGFDSRRAQSLRPCSFEAVRATHTYFTFLETSNQYLFECQTLRTWQHSINLKYQLECRSNHSIYWLSFGNDFYAVYHHHQQRVTNDRKWSLKPS